MRGDRMARCLRGAPFMIMALLAGPLNAQMTQARLDDTHDLLKEFIEVQGVSGHEGDVRDLVLDNLPDWAAPEVDDMGNVIVRFGADDGPLSVFIAHMDEVGWEVESIDEDGLLTLDMRGGGLPWAWEATPAEVDISGGQLMGVFAPRVDESERTRRSSGPMRVDIGARSRAEAMAMGVEVGDQVTNPKRLVRMAGNRVTARSFDDRAGTTAMLLALQQIDPATLDHQVMFAWVVEEEIGLYGSAHLAERFGAETSVVHAVDTFVSADSPVDLQNFAVAPIGQGPVMRAVDNRTVVPETKVERLMAIARMRDLPIQLGTTNGGTDGSAWAPWGVDNVPFGWPLRYSHSPIEVIDLADLVVLTDLIAAVVEEWWR